MAENFPLLPGLDVAANGLEGGDVYLSGVRGASLAKAMADLLRLARRPVLLVVPEAEDAEAACGDWDIFGADLKMYHFPAWDLLPIETETMDWEVAAERFRASQALAVQESAVIVAPAIALAQPVVEPPATPLQTAAPGDCLTPEEIVRRLHEAGFANVPQVEMPGQFSRRGGIVDIFPFFAEQPLRVEFDGDMVASVRRFNPLSQQSEAAVACRQTLIEINRQAFHAAHGLQKKSLLHLLGPSAIVALFHPQRIAAAMELYRAGYGENTSALLASDVIGRSMAAGAWPILCLPEWPAEAWPTAWRPEGVRRDMALPVTGVERFAGGLDIAWPEIQRLLGQGIDLTIFCATAAAAERLTELWRGREGAMPRLALGALSRGFLVTPENGGGWGAIAEHDIFQRTSLRRPRRRWASAPLASLADIRPGDYVVHLSHGIAKYEGLVVLEKNDTKQDYLQLRFADQVKIYVPLSHVDLVQRYIGSGRGRPELSRLHSGQWQRRTAAAARAVKDLAADLLRLQALRQTQSGVALPADDETQRAFEASFPYEETPDQIAAMAEIKADQMRPVPMDRLLCGDVGFGKTELAIRAAFKVVQAGKQVAMLVPTTLLAEQHARTFQERLAAYPVLIGCLSRLRPAAEQRRLILAAQEGRLDIIIGTHRLLSPDVGFKSLGLVIVDEEQRFGVEHKERLKRLRATVDILTLSATPIPRTLHMALLGLRDISTLATPPLERHAVRTAVVRSDDSLIRRAILREMARGGQCYFVHNRVQSIHRRCHHLARLIPEARFAVAHGQMAEEELLHAMCAFLAHEVDVLVCTTIIESGLDIPLVNTLLVDDADRFGLADLHQIRGRVGRYRQQAYAYFFVPSDRPLTRQARQRLQAIEEYAELGAGFRLALRDLEIRGAGNLLGVEQSGHIHNIGFDLYCRLLRRAVAEMRGETAPEHYPIEIDLGGQATLPASYMPRESERIDFYRRLLACETPEALEELRRYLGDRYGKPPPEVEFLLAEQKLRQEAMRVGIDHLGRIEGALRVGFIPAWQERAERCLRRWPKRCQPLSDGRWRVAVEEKERNSVGYRRAAAKLIALLIAAVAK